MTKQHPKFKYVFLNTDNEGNYIEGLTPVRAYENSSCYDIIYEGKELTLITTLSTQITTNLAFIIEKGYHIEIYSRSGLASKEGIIVLNAPAIIDYGYSGHIKLIMHNTSRVNYVFKRGDRIAQFRLVKDEEAPLTRGTVKELIDYDQSPDNSRKNKGLGSSDIITGIEF